MPRRVVIALLQPVRWHPPGIDPAAWRRALAEDTVDLLAALNEVDAAIAAPIGERGLAEAVAWPGMLVYETPPALPARSSAAARTGGPSPDAAAGTGGPETPVFPDAGPLLLDVLRAAAEDGYDQAAVLAPDAPDLPALLIGKLMRPLTTRAVAVAPAADRPGHSDMGGNDHDQLPAGLLGLACRLPAPDWLAGIDLDTGSVAAVRAAAPSPGQVAVTAGWRRLRDAAALATLDPAVEGWENTRALLSPA